MSTNSSCGMFLARVAFMAGNTNDSAAFASHTGHGKGAKS